MRNQITNITKAAIADRQRRLAEVAGTDREIAIFLTMTTMAREIDRLQERCTEHARDLSHRVAEFHSLMAQEQPQFDQDSPLGSSSVRDLEQDSAALQAMGRMFREMFAAVFGFGLGNTVELTRIMLAAKAHETVARKK